MEELLLEEKIMLVSGDGSWHTHAVADLPSIMMTDGPHGLRKQSDSASNINDSKVSTCFPTACAVASSWNRQNAESIAACIATEALAENVSVVLGPGINIKRSPLCGRNFEYFSEDPLLAGVFASSYVDGMQQKGVGSCLKHFAVNSQETRRMTVDAIVDERALREIYLAAFEYAVKRSNPYCIMASYNKINGTYATENEHLYSVLRDEWGYDGVVMSDWGAAYNSPKAIEAGLDLEMPEDKSGYHRATVKKALDDGRLDEACLDRSCVRLQKLVKQCVAAQKPTAVDFAFHDSVCQFVAADSAVLLKNQGILPLKINDDFCVIGELAEKPRYQGAGSSHINSHCPSFLQVLSQKGTGCHYSKGYLVDTDKPSKKLEKQAVKLAKEHKTVLFFGGLTDIYEGEGYDRATMEIPVNQVALLEKLHAVNPNIVFVAFGGAPFSVPWLGNVQALLNMYLGGQAVMKAVYDLVFGIVSPGGRLAETFPLKVQDTPCFNYFCKDRHFDEHRESIFVGYRYYHTFDIPVSFPFGFGLSYSHFEYSNLSVKQSNQGFDVEVTVKNVGQMDASEVVELFVDNPQSNLIRAKRELCAFTKVFLKSGEQKTIKLALTGRDFSVYQKGNGFVAINGEYKISLCKNVNEALLTQAVTVDFGIDAFDESTSYPDYFQKPNGSFVISDEQFYRYVGWTKPNVVATKRGQFTLQHTFEDMAPKVPLARFVLHYSKKIAKKQSQSKNLKNPVAQMVLSGARETPLISMMSVAGIDAKFIMFVLYHANRKYTKSLKALFGKYIIE